MQTAQVNLFTLAKYLGHTSLLAGVSLYVSDLSPVFVLSLSQLPKPASTRPKNAQAPLEAINANSKNWLSVTPLPGFSARGME